MFHQSVNNYFIMVHIYLAVCHPDRKPRLPATERVEWKDLKNIYSRELLVRDQKIWKTVERAPPRANHGCPDDTEFPIRAVFACCGKQRWLS